MTTTITSTKRIFRILRSAGGKVLLLFLLMNLASWAVLASTMSSANNQLSIFNSDQSANPAADTLQFLPATGAGYVSIPVPDRWRLYDLDVDGMISEWEVGEAVKDFKEQDSPYSDEEVYAFIDYFFSSKSQQP
ncbi:MAG: hypothetical protein ACKO1U_00690 [Bacteroidota bacterium]